MAGTDPKIEEILTSLKLITEKLPNGELESIKRVMDSFSNTQSEIKEDLEYFKKRLFNPDDGVIVRINKNTESIARYEEDIDQIGEIKNRVDNLEKWQGGVNKALWFVFTSIAGLVIALIFSLITVKTK
jgi:hypothetical protein